VDVGSDEEEALFEQDPAGEEEIDELDVMSYAGSSRRSASPSKLTARQRAKGNKDLQETLIALPNGLSPDSRGSRSGADEWTQRDRGRNSS